MMKKNFIDIPHYTTINEIVDKNFTLSATQFKIFCIDNDNQVFVRDLLDRGLNSSDKGNDPGTEAYVDNSDYVFVKTKSLQKDTYLLDESKDAKQNISPKFFISSNLKKGDILISHDSNVGEIAILDKDYSNAMLCGGIYKLPITKNKYYFLAFAKSELFRQQIDFLVPRGATIRHGKKKFLECKIPFPKKNVENTIEYVETLMKAILNKEISIRKKYNEFIEIIDNELKNNQKEKSYVYNLPTIKEIEKLDRMDSSLYSNKFKRKEFLLKNYRNGYSTITDLGFNFVRGNNLAVSCIGNSIYSNEYKNGFYTLILPKNLSKYGTLSKIEYLGNKSKMVKLQKGAIVFGAEGNKKGRSWVVLDDINETVTNFHGLTLYHDGNDFVKSIFIKEFLDYFRSKGMIDDYATGGNGGSLSIKYWSVIPFPNFPRDIEEKMTSKYYTNVEYNVSSLDINSFIEYDNIFNEKNGIIDIDKSMKYLQDKLDKVIADISDDKKIDIVF